MEFGGRLSALSAFERTPSEAFFDARRGNAGAIALLDMIMNIDLRPSFGIERPFFSPQSFTSQNHW
jgi:hypothetical protein